VDNIVYLCYGKGPHSAELRYSILVVLNLIGWNSEKYRIIVYTDDPSTTRDLPVHTQLLSPTILTDWAGPFGYIHRRKIMAIRDASLKFRSRLLFCDCDTFFMKHPREAFARIRPGHSLMHVGEFRLRDTAALKVTEPLKGVDLHNLAGRRWCLGPRTAMFNSGVIGLHEANISLLDEVVHLADQIYPRAPIWTIEQFAFSICLGACTRLHQAHDVVVHYWHPTYRTPFGQQLNGVLYDESISLNDRLRLLLPLRPNLKVHPFEWAPPSALRRIRSGIRFRVGRAAELTGLKEHLKRGIDKFRRA
jgi:hypothetical protein